MDAALEACVVPGFSRMGLAVRSRLLPEFTADGHPGASGRTIIITGATSGIGHAAAVELARRGAAIHFLARDRGPAERGQGEGHDADNEERGERVPLGVGRAASVHGVEAPGRPRGRHEGDPRQGDVPDTAECDDADPEDREDLADDGVRRGAVVVHRVAEQGHREHDEREEHQGARRGGDEEVAEGDGEPVRAEEHAAQEVAARADPEGGRSRDRGPYGQEHEEAAREAHGGQEVGRREPVHDQVARHHAVAREGEHDEGEREGDRPRVHGTTARLRHPATERPRPVKRMGAWSRLAGLPGPWCRGKTARSGMSVTAPRPWCPRAPKAQPLYR